MGIIFSELRRKVDERNSAKYYFEIIPRIFQNIFPVWEIISKYFGKIREKVANSLSLHFFGGKNGPPSRNSWVETKKSRVSIWYKNNTQFSTPFDHLEKWAEKVATFYPPFSKNLVFKWN